MISNERLGKIQHDLECWQEDYDPQYDAKNHQLMGDAANAIRELLALRKAFSVPVAFTAKSNLDGFGGISALIHLDVQLSDVQTLQAMEQHVNRVALQCEQAFKEGANV